MTEWLNWTDHSSKPSHPHPRPQGPKDCSIHLCLFCCLSYRVIITIFLNSIYMHEHQRRQWHPTPVLLPGKSHGWRRLAGCSPWGRWESDTTEWLHFHFSLSCIGEGNGNPLQCSCLENPRDGATWWAAVCGVAQSWTWLKWLSSSSRWKFSVKNNSEKSTNEPGALRKGRSQSFWGLWSSEPLCDGLSASVGVSAQPSSSLGTVFPWSNFFPTLDCPCPQTRYTIFDSTWPFHEIDCLGSTISF